MVLKAYAHKLGPSIVMDFTAFIYWGLGGDKGGPNPIIIRTIYYGNRLIDLFYLSSVGPFVISLR